MSISSALNAGVAGLNANATRLSTISDNIANASTFGYKRMEADFHSMVLNANPPGVHAAGGVRVTTMRMIDERGSIISTTNPTDIAISGRGFMPVTPYVSLDAPGEPQLLLATTGSFRPDADGVLRTDTGLVLMGWPANPDGTVPPFPRDTVGGLEPIRIETNQSAADPTTRIQLGANLPATATRADATGDPVEMTIEFYDNLGVPATLLASFAPEVPPVGASNSWTLTLTDPAAGAVVGEYTLTFDDTPANGGQLIAVDQPPGAPGLAFDPATGSVTVTAGGSDLAIGLANNDVGRGLTQLSDRFSPVAIVKDGSPVGNLVSVQIDANGRLDAVYDTGVIRTIYQVPLADVPNPNGLFALSNQTYRVSRDSGPFYLWNAGDGPTGSVVGFAREESATDVAAELTSMIQTQRAYSSNAKVIQTVDEMLQETTNLKR